MTMAKIINKTSGAIVATGERTIKKGESIEMLGSFNTWTLRRENGADRESRVVASVCNGHLSFSTFGNLGASMNRTGTQLTILDN